MSRFVIDDVMWNKLKQLLPAPKGRHGKDDRLFLEAVCWVIRTGAPWRDLPPDYGNWKSVYNRYNRWVKREHFNRVFEILKKDGDHEWHMIDGTIIRAHQHAAGARGGQELQALGRSRGGFSSKIHAKVDAFGMPLAFILTPGQEHEIKTAKELLGDEVSEYLLADKAYDCNDFRNELEARGTEAVIPSRKNRSVFIEHDQQIYKERNNVERFFNRIKGFRRIATRYDKTAVMFLGALTLVSILLWLKL
ncbi:MAG: IS5 family transposase [Gammaproteobacteria bacterium]|nr:IS5 family transposase [Gammaproteobacteria bacterium]